MSSYHLSCHVDVNVNGQISTVMKQYSQIRLCHWSRLLYPRLWKLCYPELHLTDTPYQMPSVSHESDQLLFSSPITVGLGSTIQAVRLIIHRIFVHCT